MKSPHGNDPTLTNALYGPVRDITDVTVVDAQLACHKVATTQPDPEEWLIDVLGALGIRRKING